MLQLRKGYLSNSVQVGLAVTLAAVLCACSEQPVPADSGAVQVAVTASSEHDQADLPVITITASRDATKNEG